MYYLGEGVEKGFSQAFRWWTIAAGGGDAIAKKNLDFLCRENPGVCESPAVSD
jgi:TPR repeat protein